jgi:hypothetical protein
VDPPKRSSTNTAEDLRRNIIGHLERDGHGTAQSGVHEHP